MVPSPDNNDLTKKIKEGEIWLAAFVAEHNLPFTVADYYLPGLIKSICPDSKIAKGS